MAIVISITSQLCLILMRIFFITPDCLSQKFFDFLRLSKFLFYTLGKKADNSLTLYQLSLCSLFYYHKQDSITTLFFPLFYLSPILFEIPNGISTATLLLIQCKSILQISVSSSRFPSLTQKAFQIKMPTRNWLLPISTSLA